MSKFTIGLIVGITLMKVLSYVYPENIRGVNQELVKQGMAKVDENGSVVWLKQCEEKE